MTSSSQDHVAFKNVIIPVIKDCAHFGNIWAISSPKESH